MDARETVTLAIIEADLKRHVFAKCRDCATSPRDFINASPADATHAVELEGECSQHVSPTHLTCERHHRFWFRLYERQMVVPCPRCDKPVGRVIASRPI